MIIDFNRYNGGGGSGSGVTPAQVQQQINSALTPYWESGETKDYVDNAVSGISLEGYATSGDMQSAFTLISETQQVAAAGLNQLEGRIDELSGASVDLSAYWTSAETQDAIDEAISGFTPSANSPIIPAITTQAEYEAISGDVKTGDLIQAQGVDLDGDNNPEYGLFGATVEEEEYEGVVRKLISWARRDNGISVFWSEEDYPWMVDNDVNPIELPGNGFLISPDMTAEDEAYNGIGFDGDGKPVITHFAPQYDEGTGEITGITRADTPIGGGADMSAYYTSAQTENAITSKNYVTSAQVETQIVNKNYITSAETANFVTSAQVETQIVEKNYITSAATANMVTSTSVSTIWKGTQAQYDAIATKDPNTFYIIVNN